MEHGPSRAKSGTGIPAFAFDLLIVAATLLAYLPAWNGRPLWDDDAHLTRPDLRSLGGLARIWFEPGATQQYYPLVHSFFWLEHLLWGDKVLPYHLVSILLHAFSAILLLRILQRSNIPGAWFAAAIFALHPIEVESVAWISELKNTLSGVFFFGALAQYLRFDESRNRARYYIALLLFVAGLLCKSVIAPLPVVLLIFFWWRRGPISARRDVMPLVPFLAIGLASGLFTAWVERRFIGADGNVFALGWIERILIAGRAFWFYLFKILWPAHLTFTYPRWQPDRTVAWQFLFPAAAAALLAASLWVVRKRNNRTALAFLLIFGALLFPALGFVNVYPFIYSFVADHFQYLAGAVVITALAVALTKLSEVSKLPRRWQAIASAVLLTALGTLTWRQSAMYSDAETLYRRTLQQNPASWMALTNISILLSEQHRYQEALLLCDQVLQSSPAEAEAYLIRGNTLLTMQQPGEAADEFEHALRLRFNPDEIGRAKALYFLGNTRLQQHSVDTAIDLYRQALKYHSEYAADAHNNLANALLAKGNFDEALTHYRKVVELRSGRGRRARAAADYNLANALIQTNQLDAGIECLNHVLKISPNYADAHNNLARALVFKNQTPEAIAHYREALRLSPDSVLFQNNLAWQLATASDARLRDGSLAVKLAEAAAKGSNRQDPAILNTLAAAYAENGQYSEALAVAQIALHMAQSAGDSGLIEVLKSEMTLFSQGLPYHRSNK